MNPAMSCSFCGRIDPQGTAIAVGPSGEAGICRECAEAALAALRERPRLEKPVARFGAFVASPERWERSKEIGAPLINLDEHTISPAALALVGREFSLAHRVLPVSRTDQHLVLAIEDPLEPQEVAEMSARLGLEIVMLLASVPLLRPRIEEYYRDIGDRL